MKRLTARYRDGYIGIKGCTTVYRDIERKGAPASNAVVRLAAYEDTGMTPDEIMAAANRRHDCKIDCLLEAHNKLLEEIERFGGMDRIKESMQAISGPLTLEELLNMNGEPVWNDTTHQWTIVNTHDRLTINVSGRWRPLSDRYYRQKPEEA